MGKAKKEVGEKDTLDGRGSYSREDKEDDDNIGESLMAWLR